jgi:hypothetical protein
MTLKSFFVQNTSEMAWRHVCIPQCFNVAWRGTTVDPAAGGSFNYSDSPHEHPHRGFVVAPLQNWSSASINRLYILPKMTSCDCDRLTETTPRFYKNNSLVWNFKTIHHRCVIDQVHISQLHSHTQSNFVLICLDRKMFRLDISHH